jgi:hypothetical protein
MAMRQHLPDLAAMHLHKRLHTLPRLVQDDKVALRPVHELPTRSWAHQLRTAMRHFQMTKS